MSLTTALKKLNYQANQFPKELYSDIHHPIIDEFDAFTDFPIPILYKELDKAYPGSKFIHTIRDEQKWLKSVHWLFTTGSIKFNTDKNGYAHAFHQAFYGSSEFDEELFLTRYREHNQEVEAYFAERPNDFLTINLAEGACYEKICAFLGVPIPEEPFPYTNQREGLVRVRFRKIHRRTKKILRRLYRRFSQSR